MSGSSRGLWSRVVSGLNNPEAELTRFQASVRYAYDLARHGGAQLVRHRAPLLAAALAYRTLFSLIPVLVLVLVVLQQVYGEDGFKEAFGAIIDALGLDEIRVSSGSGEEASSEGVAQYLQQYVENAVDAVTGLNFTWIAVVGVAVFVYAALSLLVQVEQAFNAATGTTRGRSWSRRIPTYWTLLTLGAVLLPVSFFVGGWYAARVESLPTWLAFVGGPLQVLGQVFATGLVLVFAYMRMPTNGVPFKPAVVGALIGAVFWELGKWGLGAFVVKMFEGQTAIYGTLALVPMVLFWVYVTWLIVLFGLEVAHAIETLDESALRRARGKGGGLGGPRVMDAGVQLEIAAEVARRFEGGEAVTAGGVGSAIGVGEGDAEAVLEALVNGGVLNRVRRGGDDQEDISGRYALARPASAIAASDVLDAIALCAPELEDGRAAVVVRAQLRAALSGSTLDRLAAGVSGGEVSGSGGGDPGGSL